MLLRTLHEDDAVEIVVPPNEEPTRVLVLVTRIGSARTTLGFDAPLTTRIEPTPITKRREVLGTHD